MKEFALAKIDMSPEKIDRIIDSMSEKFPQFKPEDIRRVVLATHADEGINSQIFINDEYQVYKRIQKKKYHGCRVIWLSIKRLDREPMRDWRDLQEIKNLLVGPECEGIELYPAQSRLVDTANQYHLWVIDDKHFRWPFGFFHGLIDYATGWYYTQREK